MFNRLKNYIQSQHFYPGIIGIIINPFYFARKGLLTHIQELAKYVQGKTLDVGCGRKPYQQLFNSSEYIGLEIDTPLNRQNEKVDYFYDGTTFPFIDGEFDSIVINQVLEHVFNPEVFLKEVKRVMKDGGVLLLTAPFVWDEHLQPYDFARYSSFGMKWLLENNGFEIVELRKTGADLSVIFQLLNDYIYKKIYIKKNFVSVAATLLVTSSVNVIGLVLTKLLPKNNDLYLDNVVLARKK